MNTLPDRIRAAARRKTRVRITGRSRSVTGFTVALNGRPLHQTPSKQTALSFTLAAIRVSEMRIWTVLPTKPVNG